jgi:hypothetical protein
MEDRKKANILLNYRKFNGESYYDVTKSGRRSNLMIGRHSWADEDPSSLHSEKRCLYSLTGVNNLECSEQLLIPSHRNKL